MRYRRTISNSFSFEGIGIHSGKSVAVQVEPNQSGLVFHVNGEVLELNTDCLESEMVRSTVLSSRNVSVATPEHFLSACAGLGITDLIVKMTESEMPIMDGSARFFSEMMMKAGIQSLPEACPSIVIEEPIKLEHNGAVILALPAQTHRFTYYLDYPDHFIGSQSVSFCFETDNYTSDIAPARTYGFEAEVKALLERGLAQGGSLENAVVIGNDDYLNALRFPDELARHKLLDLIGDLWVLRRPILGHIVGIRSGHHLNAELVKRLEP